jgi:hypothetical protein
MDANVEEVREALVTALADFLQADKAGLAGLDHRSKLAAARARAMEVLDTKAYDAAVFAAFRRAGFDF